MRHVLEADISSGQLGVPADVDIAGYETEVIDIEPELWSCAAERTSQLMSPRRVTRL